MIYINATEQFYYTLQKPKRRGKEKEIRESKSNLLKLLKMAGSQNIYFKTVKKIASQQLSK